MINKDKELTPGELDYVTPCEDNIYTIYIKSGKGKKIEFKVDKSKTFKVLMAKMKYTLFRNYQRIADDKDNPRNAEYKRKISDIKAGKGGFSVRFFHGENELFESERISTIGNGAEITQNTKYIGGYM